MLPKINKLFKTIPSFIKSDYYFSIFYGKKYYLWFTYENNKHIVKLYDDKNNFVENISLCYSKHLYGLILYGIIYNNKYFIIENICYYQNKQFKKNNKDKLFLLKEIFNNYKPLKYDKFILNMPIIDSNYDNLLSQLEKYKYIVYGIASANYDNNHYQIHKYKQNIVRSFIIKAEFQSDIYSIYNDNMDFIDYLYIGCYKDSVKMNQIFRTIKENDNLDYLQESDDEDFENTNYDKYVDLSLSIKMECVMSNKFKKWIPIKQVV